MCFCLRELRVAFFCKVENRAVKSKNWRRTCKLLGAFTLLCRSHPRIVTRSHSTRDPRPNSCPTLHKHKHARLSRWSLFLCCAGRGARARAHTHGCRRYGGRAHPGRLLFGCRRERGCDQPRSAFLTSPPLPSQPLATTHTPRRPPVYSFPCSGCFRRAFRMGKRTKKVGVTGAYGCGVGGAGGGRCRFVPRVHRQLQQRSQSAS